MNPEEDDLFQQEMAGVKPLPKKPVVVTPKPAEPTEAQLARREAAVADLKLDPNTLSTEYVEMVGPHDILEYKRNGVQEGVYRKLRLGKYASEATLDLHRKTLQQARKDVFEFIQDSTRFGLRTIMILHGKGERSDPPALLKSYVNKWLPSLPQVMAFHSAQKQDGGAGAVYVLLQKNETRKQQNREHYLRHARGR
ncbi:MAG: DNA endonuclease SmrA [Gammaproteobacteria bacterium]|nr:DNA endonuclease SmrA [Gammaproteobacteria bacterium]